MRPCSARGPCDRPRPGQLPILRGTPPCPTTSTPSSVDNFNWLTADDRPAPRSVRVAPAGLSADRALAFATAGTALLWRDDYPQACQLLDAMRRRLPPPRGPLPVAAEFHRRRQHRARVARLLGSVLVELHPGAQLRLRRAPDVADACREVYGPLSEPHLVALRELLGVLNAHRQRKDGIAVDVLGGLRIHPHHGVFAPTRQDYLQLPATAPLPGPRRTAFDIGTGTGVLAALLGGRGFDRVVATDADPRAVACARENLARLGLAGRVDVQERDLFPPGRADLVVANPPWLPGTPASPAEAGVYDRRSSMTDRFVRGVADHLTPTGEAWLICSDLAEHLQLRPAGHIPALAAAAGLTIRGHADVRPSTRPSRVDGRDPVAAARRRERIHLWRLGLSHQRSCTCSRISSS
ncbi:methyltransferase [Pseudonocardia sp. CA-107938]|uniref:methyltransferase n=1 Tax=Pseudonocardia sp. CA-107938 TaxID=3240021 RepID=UPI003D8F3009